MREDGERKMKGFVAAKHERRWVVRMYGLAWSSSVEMQSSCSKPSIALTSRCPRSTGSSTKREEHALRAAFDNGCHRAGDDCLRYDGRKVRIEGRVAAQVHHRVQLRSTRVYSVVDDLKASINKSGAKAKIIFIPVVKYQYV